MNSETLTIRCKSCNKELTSSAKRKTCGCPNQATICGDKITAVDLSQVVVTGGLTKKQSSSILTQDDLAFQEARRQRKVRKMEFEVR
jgi:protein-arginine kinase activator protein McsA